MERRHDLDWVRIAAFGLLVLYHVGMYYVSWDWHIKSPQAGPALEPLMLLSAPWRLSLLFLVSGVATGFLIGKSSRGFLAARSWRLLVPLLFGMFVIVVPQAYYEVVEKAGFDQGLASFYGLYLSGGLCRGEDCLTTPTWNHLWFVAYLWVYTAALAALLALFPRGMEAIAERIDRLFDGWGVLLWPLAWLAAARLLLVGTFESTHALVDDWYNHAQYFPLFLLGFWLVRAEAAWAAIERLRWVALGLALGSWAYIAWYFTAYAPEGEPMAALRYGQRGVWAVQQWSCILAVLGFARRLAPGDGPVLRYLSEAVFPVYILHQTLIIMIAWQLRPLGWAPALEGPLLTLLTVLLCFAGFEAVRRVRWLRPLFGLKRLPRAGSATTSDQAVAAVTPTQR
ncbi:acyltransferase family protein [Pseudomarimonas salicorniae]|uniref:Acyltransferase family protein n=1 Tax=Pseudomarimonas salicorniae TaxID=2933270 RepID=A0ABT0GM23_9GAMM|nr:acyltransferase family protein [Lysobacter sp. CAU 1642]MCK7595594.1 acyltransferase family protein [Lysobacter sp. CAU 1642]